MLAYQLVLSYSVVLFLTGGVPSTALTGHRNWAEDVDGLLSSNIELRLPVLAPYYDLCYVKPKPYPRAHGAFALARNVANRFWYPIVPEVTAFACQGRIIVGRCAQGYFIHDTRGERFLRGNVGWDRNSTSPPEFFTDTGRWRERMKELELPEDVHLVDPAFVATGLDRTQLKPWEYRVMKSALGLTDTAWSVIAMIVLHLGALISGMLFRAKWKWIVVALAGGLLIGILCDTLEPEGPATATLTFPLTSLIVAAISAFLRWLVSRARGHAVGPS